MNRIIKFLRKSKGELYKKSFYSFGFRILMIGVQYAFLLFITRNYGTDIWGVFAICYAFIQFTSLLCTLGLNVALVKIVSQNQFDFKLHYLKSLKYIIALNLLVSLVVFYSSSYLGAFLGDEQQDITAYIKILSIAIMPMSVLVFNNGLFRGRRQILTYNFFDGLGLFAISLLLLWLLQMYFEDSELVVVVLVLSVLLLTCVSSALAFFYFSKSRSTDNEYTFRSFFSLGLSLFWITFLNQGFQKANNLLVGIFLTNEDVGIFDIIKKLVNFTSMALLATNIVSGSKFAELHKDKDQLRVAVRQSSKTIFWLSLPFILVQIIFGPWLLEFMGVGGYEYSFLLLLILLSGQVVNNLTGSVGMLMQMTGYHVQMRNIAIVNLILNLALTIVLVPRYGLVCAAILLALSQFYKNLSSSWIIYKHEKILTFYRPDFLSYKR